LFSKIHSLLDFLEAIVVSAMVRFMLSYLPSSFRLRCMGNPLQPNAALLHTTEESAVLSQLRNKLLRVKIAVTRCNRYVPWDTECLTQALTAKQMLKARKINSLLVIGFRKDAEGEIGGHAWLKVGPYFITGYRPDLDQYVINGQFGSQ